MNSTANGVGCSGKSIHSKSERVRATGLKKAGIQTVGVIPIVALMITPSTTAYLPVKELNWMITGAILGVPGILHR
ncbi:metal ABC transporter permease [Oscillatoria sp. CS-180]|uniref:metal ABC transporter permease n=1 Tax=Oscillatoria sp. CS-180 TaxID=3021720 RepID=UPI003FA694C8